jgi:hypothetical protein
LNYALADAFAPIVGMLNAPAKSRCVTRKPRDPYDAALDREFHAALEAVGKGVDHIYEGAPDLRWKYAADSGRRALLDDLRQRIEAMK